MRYPQIRDCSDSFCSFDFSLHYYLEAIVVLGGIFVHYFSPVRWIILRRVF